MTFTEIHGNLFDRQLEEGEYYVHCISRDYACGAGIAKEFNKRYDLTQRLRTQPWAELCMKVDNVFNLVTKRCYWQKPTMKSLEDSLNQLKFHCTKTVVTKTLVMPRIGCGLDKLNWNEVQELIKDTFKDTNINIEVYYL